MWRILRNLLAPDLTRLEARVDRLETERLDRYTALESVADKLIALGKRRRKREMDALEVVDSEQEVLRHPVTGAPIDSISARILARRNGG
jgi:hypothetical protein